MKKLILTAAVAVLGLVGALSAAQSQKTADCCDGGACCTSGAACCVSK